MDRWYNFIITDEGEKGVKISFRRWIELRIHIRRDFLNRIPTWVNKELLHLAQQEVFNFKHGGTVTPFGMASSCLRRHTLHLLAQVFAVISIGAVILPSAVAQCPWPRNFTDLNSNCMCAYTPQQELSIQCSVIRFKGLVQAVQTYIGRLPIHVLYVSNSTVGVLENGMFRNTRIQNIQLSDCQIERIEGGAFIGQEETLTNLNLANNLMEDAPVEAIRGLRKLSQLDLTRNKISVLPDNAFITLKLTALKLADNHNLTLSDDAFRGIERSLKNLNLKEVGLSTIPKAIRNLTALAFLDLAQNRIQDLGRGLLRGMDSLTALNLERNFLQDLEASAFDGVTDTLRSLSLLNNVLGEYPTKALTPLSRLKVLDIGFNRIRELPADAFSSMSSLSLLALDGNPLQGIPEAAFTHLNSSLRGISLGGKALNCDCKLQWLVRWIRDYNLQVSSRERNPQFCGFPSSLRNRTFYQLNEKEMVCAPPSTTTSTTSTTTSTTTTSTSTTESPRRVRPFPARPYRPRFPLTKPSSTPDFTTPAAPSRIPAATSEEPERVSTTSIPTTTTTQPPSTTTTASVTMTTPTTTTERQVEPVVPATPTPYLRRRPTFSPKTPILPEGIPRRRLPLDGGDFHHLPPRPNILTRYDKQADYMVEELLVTEAFREDSSIVIQWDALLQNVPGYRVVYRRFGAGTFTLCPPLAATEREYRIHNVPPHEYIVVCVVSLEDRDITPANVPFSQCRELRTDGTSQTYVDKMVIGASAAICGTVIIAAIIFICCHRKRSSSNSSHQHVVEKEHLPPGFLAPPPGPPLASLGSLAPTSKEWDQISMYSGRSIPRARMYHMENKGFVPDDARSHISHASHFSSHMAKAQPRTYIDAHSQRSFSAMSGNYHLGNGFHGSSGNLSRPDDFDVNGRESRASRNSHKRYKRRRDHSKSRERSRSRSKSRNGEISSAGSMRSLTGYDDPDGNWTDHDFDIYMTRNATRGLGRRGPVPEDISDFDM
ncbi:unnamed protein product [Cyprideis torosa]|uniref:Uncharacterized protein n=1 Tax=Cyprideis torosa TaxID=163714 RepID=A0A7R8W0W3_9CRUS|nr:unnamed protein product [Cyprideis torosa]CAG0879191.1 unnamed protein product [Cyprideis torosa]